MEDDVRRRLAAGSTIPTPSDHEVMLASMRIRRRIEELLQHESQAQAADSFNQTA